MKKIIVNFTVLSVLIVVVVKCDQRLAQLGSLPVSPDHVTWNSRTLRAIPSSLTYLNTTNHNVKASQQCIDHLNLYLRSLLDAWAIKMFDSSTKIPESVASGAFIHLGNFDQCLDVIALDETGQFAFTGQYCGVKMKLSPLSGVPEGFVLPLQIASCVPSSCSYQDMQEVLQTTVGSALQVVGVKTEIIIDPINCYVKNDRLPLDTAAWVMISILILLGILLIIGTCCDVYVENNSSNTLTNALVSFSVPRNFRSLMSTVHARGSVKCLHGLRLFSLVWVMIGHCYGTDAALPNINTIVLLEIIREPWFAIIHNGLLAVDTFFFLSGFLVCFIFLNDSSKGRNFKPVLYYVNRYLRLTTCLALVIGFYICLMKYIGYGPLWRYAVYWQVDLCKKDWWLNLLYFNNFIRNEYDPANMATICVDQGWYLTVDMQLAWLAPLVLLPLSRWPYYTSRLVLPILVLASCFAPFSYTFINDAQMTTNFMGAGINGVDYGYDMYYATYMRATPYLIGICLAYFMFKIQDAIKMPKWSVLLGWLISTAVGLAVVLGPAVQYQVDYQYNATAAAFYAGFHRLAWSLVLSWIVFACSRGLGGPVNKILSWNVLLPFSRLAYCMYMSHPIVLYYESGITKTYNYYSHFSVLQKLSSDFVMTSLVALLMHLSCEAPTLGLLRIFIRKQTENMKPPDKTAN